MGELRISYTDQKINLLLDSIPGNGTEMNFKLCYDQNEELFIRLESELRVPHLPIHHDVRISVPEAAYIEPLVRLLEDIVRLTPQLWIGLTYAFNPADIFHPWFYRLYNVDDRQYLYLLELDLLFKPQYCEIVVPGTNDITPEFKTNALFVNANFIPLKDVRLKGGNIESVEILQTISETWIGERGRGYFIQGIWMDDSLTRFFSRLFLPEGKSLYPYFPFLCKFKTICGNVVAFAPDERGKELPGLHNAIIYLEPEMRNIELELKSHDFSPDLGIFKRLKSGIPDFFSGFKNTIKIDIYLNENHMREYAIVIQN